MADISLTPVRRGRLVVDGGYLFEDVGLGTASDPSPTHDRVECPVYNVVVEHPEATILWDTGSHPDAADGHWPAAMYDAFTHEGLRPLREDLDAAGFDLADVDAVVQSHLHLDHAGGLDAFAGTDVPVYVHRAEFSFAYLSAKTGAGDAAYLAPDFDHDLDWRLVSGERATPFRDVDLVHLPGHSPGLVATVIHREADTVILAGDVGFVDENVDDRRPMDGSLLWNKAAWFDSLDRLADLRRRHDATVLTGHDPDAPDRLDEL
ncbi:N-acyl homoserine lactonase family protein [Haloarchaeobius litoreus]|uniref:N-acyl homoserine lactonase family protein n=1 Tax=Haloarchaeobius litoreus TaxID=755306 RepID=A0ABD6DKQ5_9EURY|nr:N-acyl homoserine lactonase family protein [Haloarchaeobius litoreus]